MNLPETLQLAMAFNNTNYTLKIKGKLSPKAILIFASCFFTFFVKAQSDSSSNTSVNKVLSILNKVEENGNFLDKVSPDSTTELPFGIIKQIGAARYVIAIDSMKFKPTGAYFSAYAAIDFPGSTKKLAFEAVNIKFNPKGVVGGNQARLMLVSEHIIKINSNVYLKLKNDGNNFVEWDCNGFKAISLKGHFIFSKNKFIPDPEQTQDSLVTASFQIYTQDIHNFITQVSITPFTISGLKNWSFKVNNATVDMSELANAPGMIFPAGYSNPNMITAQMWTGFYLQALTVKLPSEISKAGTRNEVAVNNLLIDNMGLSGLFKTNNLFSTDEGSMSGWGFSIDELSMHFLCNEINGGGIKGKVRVPAFDSAQALLYNASVYYNPLEKQSDYSFTLNPANDVSFNVFSAKVNLANTSRITVIKNKGLLFPTAVLNGNISFNHKKFNSEGGQLEFQSLTFITQSPYITNGVFTLHNIGNQTKAAKYPVSINEITFGINQGAPVLGFSVALNTSDEANSGFGAGTKILLKGKINSNQQTYNGSNPVTVTKTNWAFDKLDIGGISIDVQTTPFTLKGFLLFREDDPTYGDGFFGQAQFSLKKVLPAPSMITACFGAKDSYRYFYADAAIPANIPLGSLPVTLNKLMGGMYYHMTPVAASQQQLVALSQNQSASVTGALSYSPNPNSFLGLKAGLGFRYTPSEKAANGDAVLDVNFTTSGGLGGIKLSGDVYVMAEIKDRLKAPVKGTILVNYDPENSVFDADINAFINAYNSVTGSGSAKIHIAPGIWYTSVGKPSAPVKINILNLASAQSYFMIGNKIEAAPALPPEITSIMSQSGMQAYRNESLLSSGSGFCGGAKMSSSLNKTFGWDFFSVYGGFSWGLGFDMMLLNYGANATCAGTNDQVGMNGWLANGAMYIYMQGNVGIKGNIHFVPGCNCEKNWCFCSDFDLQIFNGGFASMVNAKLPKPLYFNGQFSCNYSIFGKVNGNFDFNYEFGKDCTPVAN